MQKRFSLVTSVWIQRKSPIHLELGAGLGYSGYVLGSNMQLYMAFLLSVILSCFKGLDQLSLFKQCDMFCVCSTELPDCLLCAWVFFRHVCSVCRHVLPGYLVCGCVGSFTWLVWGLTEVLWGEGFPIGVFWVWGQPGVQVSTQHVHQHLHKDPLASVLCFTQSLILHFKKG